MSVFKCPKCGADLDVKPGSQMATCSFCGTVTYIDRSSALFFYLLPFSIEENAAKGIFKRWSAGPAYPKDMETSAKVTKMVKEYFPVFRFRRTVNSKEDVEVKPAKGTVLPGMQNLVIPPGSMEIYNSKSMLGNASVIEPDIGIDSYAEQLPGEAIDQSLVYFPIYEVTYDYKGKSYETVIDGSSGKVYSGSAPKRSSTSYMMVIGLAFALGFLGGILGLMVFPGFLVLIVVGSFAGKILGNRVVQRQKVSAPAEQKKEEAI
ncbi:MAG: hypothetical protein Q4Q53_07375 [Methanocorpusculum sp.]|nr:hypothetical protein [Methanocorpusculum sp.]